MAILRVVGVPQPITVLPGATLLQALLNAGLRIRTSCGGRASCGLCRLTVLRGMELLSPLNAAEVGHLGNVAKVVAMRLACQCVVMADGDIEVDVPPVADVSERKRSQVRRQRSSGFNRNNGADEQRRVSSPPLEQVEWRPRKLAEEPGDEPKK